MFVGICLAVTVKRCWDVPEPEDPDSLKILHFKLAKARDELHSLSTEIKRSSTSSERGNAASYTFAVGEVQVLQERGTDFLISSDPTRSVAMHACKHSSILKYANTWQSWLGSEVSQKSLEPMKEPSRQKARKRSRWISQRTGSEKIQGRWPWRYTSLQNQY